MLSRMKSLPDDFMKKTKEGVLLEARVCYTVQVEDDGGTREKRRRVSKTYCQW